MSDFLVRFAADYMMIAIVLLGAYALIFKTPKGHRWEAYKRILVAGLTTYLFAKLIAAVYEPDAMRPFELLSKAAGASYLPNPGFPSDHILLATAISAAVWFETKQKGITIALAIMTAIVGIGRIVALVHTPIDVLGGIVIGLMGAVWYLNPRDKS